MSMIKGDNTSSITPTRTVMGILMDNELLPGRGRTGGSRSSVWVEHCYLLSWSVW